MHWPFFFPLEESGGREVAWWQSAFELSTASAVSGQLHQHLAWTRGRNGSASLECQKDLIIIFGKATRSGSIMSLLRITLLIAFLDV